MAGSKAHHLVSAYIIPENRRARSKECGLTTTDNVLWLDYHSTEFQILATDANIYASGRVTNPR